MRLGKCAVATSEQQKQQKIEDAAATALVREHDRDRYRSTLFAPPEKRRALTALYALNVELERIVLVTDEPMAGQIRLQWWRDSIDFAEPQVKVGSPLADALRSAMFEHNLPKERLIGMVDAHSPIMFGEAPETERALKDMFRATEGVVFELAAAILGDTSEAAREASRHAGVAYGLTEMFIELPLLASRRRLMLPKSYVETREIDLDAVYRGETTPNFAAATADLRGLASRFLKQFRTASANLDARAWPAFLPLTLVKPYLKAMTAPGFDPLQTVVSLNPVRRLWRIWRSARRHSL